jgi:hypothetical protein
MIEVKLGSENYNVTVETDENGEYIVFCFPKEASGELFGFGKTLEEAIENLKKNYGHLMDFRNECEEEWWKEKFIQGYKK